MATVVHIESPVPGGVTTPYVRLSGWVACDPADPVRAARAVFPGGVVRPLALVSRPDVEAHHVGCAAAGFQRLFTLDECTGITTLTVEIEHERATTSHDVPVQVDPAAAAGFRAARERKAERIRSVLACPRCHAPLDDVADGLRCTACGTGAGRRGGMYDFLPAEVRASFAIRDTDNISAWGYDDAAMDIVRRHAGGLVLDCGCGLRPSYLDDVVNYEVVDYPTTDVLGVGQALPFRDGSIDAVFSFAVLEHVTDPFACASELVRVLRPGGTLFAVVPFLQPFHGYPDHYYNMTSSGLRNLFPDSLAIDEIGVPRQGLPVFALSWILNSYSRGLPVHARERFEQMTVRELMADPWPSLQADHVAMLGAAATEELATTNFVIGTKR